MVTVLGVAVRFHSSSATWQGKTTLFANFKNVNPDVYNIAIRNQGRQILGREFDGGQVFERGGQVEREGPGEQVAEFEWNAVCGGKQGSGLIKQVNML